MKAQPVHTPPSPPPAWCVRCAEETPTIYRRLRGGQVMNLCHCCLQARKGKPFISPSVAELYLNAVLRQEGFDEQFYA